MFRDALDYPTRPPIGGRSVLVGGALLLFVGIPIAIAGIGIEYAPVGLVAVLPWLLVRGYYVRVVRTTAGRTYPTPPRFGDVDRLFADGIRAVAIAALYLLPGVVVLGPLVVARTTGVELPTLFARVGLPAALSNAALSVTGLLALFALLYLIGALYALPVAVANFAYTDRFAAAFDLRTVLGGSLTEDYAVAWVVSVVIQALLIPVAYPLRAVLVGFFLHFFAAVAVRYCYGQGVGAALGWEPVGTTPDEESRDGAGEVTAAIRHIDGEWEESKTRR
ncbi:DUF4013 domain-containing protein [Natronomonas gomsonensis]|uniref:DUF4013 domain-containing protein n=1 Tax=Natronomonas gomsonensis TaxID=1046043 RepID=UPI0020CA8093|nr:DUF4013 domain-containing protein [Natronomonas gomsonensis]MCY4729244.1 DUF4013 domain-containing protein [Natronomonas gomsonensis]